MLRHLAGGLRSQLERSVCVEETHVHKKRETLGPQPARFTSGIRLLVTPGMILLTRGVKGVTTERKPEYPDAPSIEDRGTTDAEVPKSRVYGSRWYSCGRRAGGPAQLLRRLSGPGTAARASWNRAASGGHNPPMRLGTRLGSARTYAFRGRVAPAQARRTCDRSWQPIAASRSRKRIRI